MTFIRKDYAYNTKSEKCCGCESQQIAGSKYRPNSILIIYFNVSDKFKIARGPFIKKKNINTIQKVRNVVVVNHNKSQNLIMNLIQS